MRKARFAIAPALFAVLLLGAGCARAPEPVADGQFPAESLKGPTLNLSKRGLESVPRSIFDKTSAVLLDVSENRLTGALPAEIRLLSRLEIIDASRNRLTGVPAEIGQLSRLRVLDLSDNQLTGLPLELGNLQNLETLDLSGNPDLSERDLELIRAKLPASTRVIR